MGQGNSGEGSAADGKAVGNVRSSVPRWLRIILPILLVIGLGFAVWQARVGQFVISAAHHRNFHALAVAAGGLEYWPGAVRGLAVANFVRERGPHGAMQGNLEDADARHDSEGWDYAAVIFHPRFGRLEILYKLEPEGSCDAFRDKIAKLEKEPLPFISSYRVGEGPQLKILDHVPLKEIWLLDHGPRAGIPALIPIGDKPAQPKDTMLCYGLVVSLDKLLALEQAAPQFSNVLILDGGRRVRQQLGARPVAVESLDRLTAADSVLNAALMSASGLKPSEAASAKPLANALQPVPVDIEGVGYEAYIHPFHLPPGVSGCETGKSGPEPASCFLVGLMPRSALWQSALHPTPFFLIVLGFTVAIILALLLPARFLLMGAGDAVARCVGRAAILSVLVFSSLATLLILFSLDVAREREAMAAQARRTSARLAEGAHAQIIALADRANAVATAGGQDLFGGYDPKNKSIHVIGVTASDLLKSESETRQSTAIDSVTAVSRLGSPLACGAWQVKFRDRISGRFNVAGRDYFQRFLQKRFDGIAPGKIRYTIDQVRSQTDGINKTILVQTLPRAGLAHFPVDPGSLSSSAPSPGGQRRQVGRTEQEAEPEDENPCLAFALLTSAVLPAFHAPILPYRLGYAVIDTRNPVFPVLMHQDPGRVGTEDMAHDLDRPGLHHLSEWVRRGMPAGYAFAGRYDGKDLNFYPQHIAGTAWTVLVYYSDADVDQTPATTVGLALIAGCALSIVFLLAWTIFASLCPGVVANVWPHEREKSRFLCVGYGPSSCCLAALVAVSLISAVFFSRTTALIVAGLVAFLCLFLLHLNNWKKGKVGHPLQPRTERLYFLMVLIFVAGAVVLPTIAIWREASARTRFEAANDAGQAMLGKGGAFERRWSSAKDLRNTWCWRDRCTMGEFTSYLGGPLYLETSKWRATKEPEQFLKLLWDQANTDPRSEPGPSCAARADDSYCRIPDGNEANGWVGRTRMANALFFPEAFARKFEQQNVDIGFSLHRLPRFPGSDALYMIGLMALVLLCGLIFLVRRLLVAFAGFGISIGVVSSPRLTLSVAPDSGERTLPTRALLVGAPYSLRYALRQRSVVAIDLTADDAGGGGNGHRDAEIYLVTDLHLVLRDPDRRRVALERLETLDATLAADARLVILSSQAPLERILDAYERDRWNPEEQALLSRNREQLRWASLFEKFATICFPPSRKIDFEKFAAIYLPLASSRRRKFDFARLREEGPKIVRQLCRRARCRLLCKDRTDRAALRATVTELTWLPEEVLATITDVSPLVRSTFPQPPTEGELQSHFTPPAVEWALSRHFASRAAAFDELHGLLVEHYQKCWSASTYAERVVLDHVAHQRLVNMGSARIPLASLVRRGLVRFEPEPRLMNRSFALFARQTERPDTPREWRRNIPGVWDKVSWPLLFGIPVLIALLAIAWMWSDTDTANFAPLLVAGAPALVAGVMRSIRRQQAAG